MIRTTRIGVLGWVVLVVGALALVTMGGCNPLVEARDTAQAVGDEARERAAGLQQDLADAQAALDEARALGLEAEARRLTIVASSLEGEIAMANATAETADAAVAEAERLIAEAAASEGLFEQVPILNLLPPPYREGASLALVVGTALWRNQKWRGAATSIVRSIEVARKEDPAADEFVKRNANTLRAVQTPMAQRIVDQVQTKRTIVPV